MQFKAGLGLSEQNDRRKPAYVTKEATIRQKYMHGLIIYNKSNMHIENIGWVTGFPTSKNSNKNIV